MSISGRLSPAGACLSIMQTTEIRRENNVVAFTDGGNLWYRLLYKEENQHIGREKSEEKVSGRQADRKNLP